MTRNLHSARCVFSLEEECGLSLCNETLEGKNMLVHGALQRFCLALSRVQTHVGLLAAQSELRSRCEA